MKIVLFLAFIIALVSYARWRTANRNKGRIKPFQPSASGDRSAFGAASTPNAPEAYADDRLPTDQSWPHNKSLSPSDDSLGSAFDNR